MKLKKQYEEHQEIYKQGYIFNPDTNTFFKHREDFKLPPGYEDWNIEEIDLSSYLNERLEEMGLSEEANQVELIGGPGLAPRERTINKIFDIDKRGNIDILQYKLNREPHTYSENGKDRFKYNVQTRLAPWDEHILDGKYNFSKAKNAPFWPPLLLQEHEAEKKELSTLIITEGQIKAATAANKGIPVCGLTSISHFRDGKTKSLHPEIVEYIKANEITRVVVLWDGDCRDISTKAIQDKKDLQKRPFMFWHYAKTIREEIREYDKRKNLSIFFGTILSDQLEGNPKGIDDLILSAPSQSEKIKNDLLKAGEYPSSFFKFVDISNEQGITKLRRWFKIDKVGSFFQFHQDKIGKNEFIFNGSTHEVKDGQPVVKIAGDLKKYMRVGTDYYRIVNEPTPVGKDGQTETEETLVPWTSAAIAMDHGKTKLPLIQKYLGFTNVASHVNYNQVIDNHYNLYQNIDHKAQKGKWEHIQKLLKHLFQEQYEMVLDYITVLYRHPFQKLPVVCLVSKEQKTGKSTFVYLLKLIFKQNMAIISNNDLTSDFNSHWTSKLIVASEETMLEKKDAYEKIKAITTQRTIMRNEKNKAAKEIPCMVHFVFCSNHEDDFIRIDNTDSRLWIRKISTIQEKIKGFDQKIENEIPAFVHFIQEREIQYEDVGERLYFAPEHFRTDAFQNVVKHSEPSIVKEMRLGLKELFLTTGEAEIRMTARDLKNEFGLRGEANYINKTVKQYFKAQKVTDKHGRPTSLNYQYKVPGQGDTLLITKKSKGRFFIFQRWEFLDSVELAGQQTSAPLEPESQPTTNTN